MATVGPNYSGISSSSGTVGGIWNNPTTVTGNTIANCYILSPLDSNNTSRILYTRQFGFNIASGSTIDGITVEIQKKTVDLYGTGGYSTDDTVKLVNSASSITGSNKADTVTHWSSSNNYVTYGSSTDKWSAGMTLGDVNSTAFGVAFRCFQLAGPGSSSIQGQQESVYQTCRITINYTTSGGGATYATSMVVINPDDFS